MGAFANAITEDRKTEESFFRTGKPPQLPKEVIVQVRVYLDADSDFVCSFESGERRYVLCVVLPDSNRIGWKACQAIGDVIKVAQRGTKISNELFLDLYKTLETKYGRVDPPKLVEKHLLGVIYPTDSPLRTNSPNQIESLGLTFDRDGDMIWKVRVSSGLRHLVIFQLPTAKQSLFVQDCKALMDFLEKLEPGDTVDQTNFLSFAGTLRKEYNFVKLVRSGDGKEELVLTITASRVHNTEEIDPVFVRAMEDVRRKAARDQAKSSSREVRDLGGRYPGIRMGKLITASGQADLYSGTREKEKVAVKIFRAAESHAEYKTELRMLLKMEGHPNVIEVLDFFETPQPALVTKYIEGSNLSDLVGKQGPLPDVQARKLAVEIAKGISHLHKSGIIHRDLKSPNVMVDPSGKPVIIDLGLGSTDAGRASRSRSHGLMDLAVSMSPTSVSNKTDATKGSIPWMTPEMMRKQEWSEKTDVYAFGIILWEMLSGREPYSDAQYTQEQLVKRVLRGGRPDLSAIARADPTLQSLVQSCWQRDPERRPTIRKVLDILERNDPDVIFKKIDKDGSGTLEFPEFAVFLHEYAPGMVPDKDMFAVFSAVDHDNSGGLSLAEFEAFWKHVDRLGLPGALALFKRRKLHRRVWSPSPASPLHTRRSS